MNLTWILPSRSFPFGRGIRNVDRSDERIQEVQRILSMPRGPSFLRDRAAWDSVLLVTGHQGGLVKVFTFQLSLQRWGGRDLPFF